MVDYGACLKCGEPNPTTYVVVAKPIEGDVTQYGRVCGGHTLVELHFDPENRFDLQISYRAR